MHVSFAEASIDKRALPGQAAEYLGIKKQTLHQWCSEKKTLHMKVGGKTFLMPKNWMRGSLNER